MRIAIDLTALLPRPTGVDNYMKRLVIALGKIDHENRYTILLNYEDRRLFDGLLPPNFAVVARCLRPRPVRLLVQQVGLPAAASVWGVDVVHSPAFLMPLCRGRQRHLLTVHDMTSFTLPECHIPLRRGWLYRRAMEWSIRRADLISVPSRASERDVLRLMPGVSSRRIRVIAEGVGEEFRPRATDDVQAATGRLRPGWPYILYVGTIEPRKNLERLLESYRQLIVESRVPEHLVLAGRLGWGYRALLARVASPELRGRVHLPGYVRQRDLPGLYAGARLFVYPSLQEGFGLPPLEAMACGVPTVASRSSALAENLEGAAELVVPTDAAALTAAMKRLLRDERLRAQRRDQGLARAAAFRWVETARQTLACYKTLAAPTEDVTASPRPMLRRPLDAPEAWPAAHDPVRASEGLRV